MTSAPVPSYSALYSISDLHLGGEPGMQMFGQDQRLGGFLEWLATPKTHAGDLALVLAGDVIDSLPTLREGEYVAVDGAADLVREVARSFPRTFEGLSAFVKAARRELIVLIGNHDIELALPEAQAAFLACIGSDKPSLRGRVRFETRGTGFRCSVSSRTVYVTHGNEADRWNHVDHEALRRAAHARALGLPFDRDSWTPNAGTMLVVETMNDIKRRYPFVDLLKPETSVMLPLLAVLDEKRLEHVYAALPAFRRRAWAQTGPGVVLGQSDRGGDPRTRDLLEAFESAGMALALADEGDSMELFEKVRKLHRQGQRPEELVFDDGTSLGIVSWFKEKLQGLSWKEGFRRALKHALVKDKEFSLTDEDEVFKGVMGQVAAGVDVVITGHTHMARWIQPQVASRPVYLNAGTWARLMALDPRLLEPAQEAEYERLIQALKSPGIQTLDDYEAVLPGGPKRLLLDATCAARVEADGGGASAVLVRVKGDGSDVEPVDPASDPRSWS